MFKFMIGFIIFLTIVSYMDFLNNPERYGDIMRRFDEARYIHLDY